jgi:hypothetical protein
LLRACLGLTRRRDIDNIVMNYLVSHGYRRTAAKFAKEAGVPTHFLEEESIEARVEIRHAIHKGDIDTAINKINDQDPQVSATTLFSLPAL